eukprot:CAMPEP_0115289150 /NCGR_PEP_ID=MMETSP0270-20121206/63353_1 /TAXON_ID=71861 /ORGANISM="Scrippsiella trochoidea, Strain CCMP3099" /LENGTH=39 /DNA_ID= /DNA_START= /DNA_END= /DNA_ORIENTATION=
MTGVPHPEEPIRVVTNLVADIVNVIVGVLLVVQALDLLQ